MRPESQHSVAFTVVELLVTVACIAILTGLLITAIPTVKSAAQLGKCCTNLRQIGTLVMNYAADNNGELPITRESGLFSFAGRILPDVKFSNRSDLLECKLFYCPADKSGGTATYSVTENSSSTPGTYVRNSTEVTVKGLCPLAAFPRPAQTFLLVESPNKLRTYTQNGNGSIVTPKGQFDSGGIALHNKKGANYLFLDGHVEFIAVPMDPNAGYLGRKFDSYTQWIQGYEAR